MDLTKIIANSDLRILIFSKWFSPSTGGVETVSVLLAEEFTKAGASVVVVTDTPGPVHGYAYKVVRQPSRDEIRTLVEECSVILQNMISLRFLARILPTRKPIVIAHHSWMRRIDGSRGLENYIKILVCRFCHNVAISRSISDSLPVNSQVIGNPFDVREFETAASSVRARDILFMGRLVSDKGCDLLLQAVGHLSARSLFPSVTIIGDGPEMAALKDLAVRLNIVAQVNFAGSLQQGRGALVADHKIMAIPSRWSEPFGLVALEGIASGCAIVASNGGGLPEAAGPCGVYFPNGNAEQLATRLEQLLRNPTLCLELVAKGPEHLRRFQPGFVASLYIEFFKTLVR